MKIVLALFGFIQSVPMGNAAWKERHFPPLPELPRCSFQEPASEVTSLGALPEKIGAEVRRYFEADGGLADTHGEFNSTDFIDDPAVPRRRFLRAYLTEDVWFIWYEKGGLARNLNTLAMTRQRGRTNDAVPYRAAPGSGFTGNLCAGSKAFLSGARASSTM